MYYQGFISQSRESIINMLEFYSSGQRSKKSSPIFHASINFPLNEQLDDDTLVNIAKDYMAGMGYAEQPFVVFRHDDTKHRHVHIVSTRVDVKTGKRISDKFERVRSQSVSAKIEREYGLQRVERYKGKGYQAQQENLVDVLDKKFQEIFASYAPKNLKDMCIRDSVKGVRRAIGRHRFRFVYSPGEIFVLRLSVSSGEIARSDAGKRVIYDNFCGYFPQEKSAVGRRCV